MKYLSIIIIERAHKMKLIYEMDTVGAGNVCRGELSKCVD